MTLRRRLAIGAAIAVAIAVAAASLSACLVTRSRLLGDVDAGLQQQVERALRDGGQIVVAPSIHPDTGRPYRWANNLPVASLKELVDHARANPGKLAYGTPGTGTAHHLNFELFLTRIGARMVHVPYKGAAPMTAATRSDALALLADGWARARGGRILALTVDHGLRAESANEARQVGAWLAARGIAHAILPWIGPKPTTGIQAAARGMRHSLLGERCRADGILHLLLAHHRGDLRARHSPRCHALAGQYRHRGRAQRVRGAPPACRRPPRCRPPGRCSRPVPRPPRCPRGRGRGCRTDRKSTRLNSSHRT